MISQKSDHAAFSCYELTNHIYYALYTIHFPYHIRGAAASCRPQFRGSLASYLYSAAASHKGLLRAYFFGDRCFLY